MIDLTNVPIDILFKLMPFKIILSDTDPLLPIVDYCLKRKKSPYPYKRLNPGLHAS